MGYFYEDDDSLEHHGIKGQKWGVRRFQNADGSLTSKGKSRYGFVESPKEHEENRKRLHDMTTSGQMDRLRSKAMETSLRGKKSEPSKRELKKEVKLLGKMYKEAEMQGYMNSGDKLEKYYGKKYFDLIDRIESTAAKEAAANYTKKYGDVHVDQIGSYAKKYGERRIAYWLKELEES